MTTMMKVVIFCVTIISLSCLFTVGLMLAKAKIATRKRADIMKVEGDTEARV